jgi:WD repeat-containing protein 1 (actin-interacting protein 1)
MMSPNTRYALCYLPQTLTNTHNYCLAFYLTQMITGRWSFHSGRILSLAWTADGAHVASSALDTHVYVWSVKHTLRNIAIKNAAAGGVNVVLWLEGRAAGTGRLAGAGADGCVRVWDVTFHV